MTCNVPTIRIMCRRRNPGGGYSYEIIEDVVVALVFREKSDLPHLEIMNDGHTYDPLPLPWGKI